MRTVIIVALFSFMTLAGCAEDTPAPVQDDGEPCVVEDATDFSCAQEDAATGADRAHIHDYWGGAERLTVADEDIHLGSTNLAGGTSWVLDIPDGSVIPQGTKTVEVTWIGTPSEDDAYSELTMYYQTAAAQEWIEYGAIEWGETYAITSTNQDNDLPHQQLSGWQFRLTVQAGAGVTTHVDMDVRMVVEAIRGLEIPLYPGHPDRWDGAESIHLLEQSGMSIGSDRFGRMCFVSCTSTHTPDDGAIIPWDADRVEVTLTTEPALTSLGLSYHGADSRQWTRLEATDVSGTSKTYVIPVDGQADGPYALQSLWAFFPFIEEPAEDVFTATTEYTITAAVHRSP